MLQPELRSDTTVEARAKPMVSAPEPFIAPQQADDCCAARGGRRERADRRLPISEHLHQQLLAGGRKTAIPCELEARSLVNWTPALVDTGTLRRIVAGTL
jgi:hypothetical protein